PPSGRLFEKPDDLGAIEQVSVKEHLNGVAGGHLRLRLAHAEMDGADGPPILPTKDSLGDQSSTARHRATHPCELRGGVRGSAPTDYPEKTGQLVYLRVNSLRRAVAENTPAARSTPHSASSCGSVL